MQTREWRFMDKTTWGEGPWQTEPDKVQWQDPTTGLPCMVRRSPTFGGWCGYVGVPSGHPLHGKHYDEVGEDLEVHGGLTFTAGCDGDPERGICHVPEPGEPDDVWWLGFDCGHYMDLQPGIAARELELGMEPIRTPYPTSYKNLAYVQEECARLAAQLV